MIALVITIIILLLLAGIAISMITGKDGILIKAGEAKNEMEQAQIEEQIYICINSSYNTRGEIDIDLLKKNLKKISGINEELVDSIEETDSFKDSIFPVIIEINDKSFQIIDENRVNVIPDGYIIYDNITLKGYTSIQNEYQYINTEYIPTDNTGIESKCKRLASTNANSLMFGAASQDAENPMDFGYLIQAPNKAKYCFGKGGTTGNFKYIKDNDGNIVTIGNMDASENGKVVFFMDKNKYSLKTDTGDIYIGDNESYKEKLNITVPITIGGENVAEGEGRDKVKINYSYSRANKMFEYLRIYEYGKLVRNYIPCKKANDTTATEDKAYGMLETIEGKYYPVIDEIVE